MNRDGLKPDETSAMALARSIRRREVSARSVVEAHLTRIAELNPALNAFCTVTADQALAAADHADHLISINRLRGPLHGLPVAIKDATDTAGIRTTYGSPTMADHMPGEDAPVVARLKAAGAIIIGKTNTSEFTAGANTTNALFGATRNPHDPQRTSGGSSGGSAVAVATNMAALAQGTDLGGSLRIPAAFCGVLGLRPTPGLVPGGSREQPFDTQNVVGPIARTAEDIALFLDAVSGPAAAEPLSSPPQVADHRFRLERAEERPIRLAFVPGLTGLAVDPAIAGPCERAVAALSAYGVDRETLDLDLSPAREAYSAIRGQWMANQFAGRPDLIDRVNPQLAQNITQGLGQRGDALANAERIRADLWRRAAAAFARVDVIATPTVPLPPFPVDQLFPTEIAGEPMANYIDWAAPTFAISLLGLPALSMPVGADQNGLPVGLQLVGRRFAEVILLSTAKRFDRQS